MVEWADEQLRAEFVFRRIAVEAAVTISLPLGNQGELSYYAEGLRGSTK